jgi:transposase
MRSFVGLDVSQATTAICVVDEEGRTLAEGKVPTCPRTIAAFVRSQAPGLVRIGLETGPLAVWLFGALRQDGLPVICLDARHANAGLALMPNKTDRNDAAGIAQIVRTGWFRQVHVRSEASYVVRARLAARTTLVRQRCEVDNQIRGVLKTFGIVIGKAPGGLRKRAAEIAGDELAHQPELAQLVRMLLALRETLCDRIADLDRQLIRQAKAIPVCRRFMTVPGVGVVVALSVWAAIDDPGRFAKSASVGAYLGLTPRRYASGEIDRQGRITKRGDAAVRTHLYEAANVLLTRIEGFSVLKAWGLRIAKRSGFKKAKVAVARKLAIILHRIWRDGTEFRWGKEVPLAA